MIAEPTHVRTDSAGIFHRSYTQFHRASCLITPCYFVTPTIAVFMPDGKPFVPAEGNKIPFILYSDRNTGEHMVTVAEGALPLDMLRALAEELLVD